MKLSEVQMRLLDNFSRTIPLTCNEVADILYQQDFDAGIRRGIHYYTHLNKRPSRLERRGLLIFTGEKKLGPTGKMEKLWLRAP